MGSKAWRNLGAIFLACAGLVGCNNGPEKIGGGGPFGGTARQWNNPSAPASNTTVVGQGTQGQPPPFRNTSAGPASTAGGSFQPQPTPGPFPGSGTSLPPGGDYQRMGNNNMTIPPSPAIPTQPMPTPFGSDPRSMPPTSPGGFPGGTPPSLPPSPPAGFPGAGR